MFATTVGYISQAWRSTFIRNVAIVASGTAGAQAINMAFAPLITRLYGPEAFGLLGAFLAVVTILTPLAALAYPIAIVLPRSDSEARGIARLSLLIVAFVTFPLLLVFLFAGDLLGPILGLDEVGHLILLIPLVVLLLGLMSIIRQWLIRKKQFRVTARVAIIHSAIVNSAKAGLGWFHPVAGSLILLATIGSALHVALLCLGLRLSRKPEVVDGRAHDEPPPSLGAIAARYYDFPAYRAPQNFINAASQSLPILLLASLFGPAAAGFYAIGMTVMGLPSTLIGASVSDVLYPRVTEAAHRGEDITGLILRATMGLVAIGSIPFGLVVLFGPGLFEIVFGSAWTTAGEYARWLALFFFANFINKPAVAAVPVLGLQRGLLIYEFFSTGSKVVALYLGFYLFKNDLVAVALFSVFGVIAYTIMILWIVASSRRRAPRSN